MRTLVFSEDLNVLVVDDNNAREMNEPGFLQRGLNGRLKLDSKAVSELLELRLGVDILFDRKGEIECVCHENSRNRKQLLIVIMDTIQEEECSSHKSSSASGTRKRDEAVGSQDLNLPPLGR